MEYASSSLSPFFLYSLPIIPAPQVKQGEDTVLNLIFGRKKEGGKGYGKMRGGELLPRTHP